MPVVFGMTEAGEGLEMVGNNEEVASEGLTAEGGY
jgi:hypothetical protein